MEYNTGLKQVKVKAAVKEEVNKFVKCRKIYKM